MFMQVEAPIAFKTLVDELFESGVERPLKHSPSVQVLEDELQTTVIAELPGVKKDDVKITFEDGVLTLSGTRAPFELPKNGRVLLNELRTREFQRGIRPAHDVEASQISAQMADGVLTVVLPKAERAKARTIAVQ